MSCIPLSLETNKVQEYARQSQTEMTQMPQKQLTKERKLMTEETKPKYTKEQIDEARQIIQSLIQDKESAYKKMLEEPDDDLDVDDYVELDAITTTGFDCKMWVDKKDIAKVLLEYDYPLFSVMRRRSPKEMWNKLASIYGMGDIEDISDWMLI